jgi:TRAP-type C4-dicarboxylate transport system permease small subunit
MTLINKALSMVSGGLLFAIGLLSVFEACMRSLFDSPTIWSLDVSLYFLVLAIFLGSSYAYQEKGHVAVDFLKDVIEKRMGKRPRRVISVIGYIIAFITLLALMLSLGRLFISALRQNTLTIAMVQIPISILYAIMIAGTVIMVITVFFIILDLFTEDEKYL